MSQVVHQLTCRYTGRSVILVTHVTPVKALVARALNAPASAVFRMELSPGSFTRITYTRSDASLRLFNDTSHLH